VGARGFIEEGSEDGIEERFENSFENLLTKFEWFVLFELFPLKRKTIFERYIVRLIGTPNQNLKTYDSFHYGERDQ
jgi:hypothetical protein